MRSLPGAAVVALSLIVGLAGATSATAQSESTRHNRVFGYQDTETGDFHALPQIEPDVTGATPPTTGKYQITFNVKLQSSFPSGTEIACEVLVDEVTSITTTTPPYVATTIYTEIATSTVGASGSAVTCHVSLPYSWVIPAASKGAKTTVSGTYSVSAINASSTTTLANALRARSSSSQLPIPQTLPANGSTTSATVNATL